MAVWRPKAGQMVSGVQHGKALRLVKYVVSKDLKAESYGLVGSNWPPGGRLVVCCLSV